MYNEKKFGNHCSGPCNFHVTEVDWSEQTTDVDHVGSWTLRVWKSNLVTLSLVIYTSDTHFW